ncbi:hypothetical protein [Nonomuraea aurantiaca]|uniref:hypothetical protein n=1 Tax=Nonomuraea aurantiaca TaxID=2878562 RepID=UPI001CDA1791|nr:hypothetical protein [Nonomuraea aurantiaca]MCA2225282.1 hypothetical protein [Nonomuraea aurantiaca]
MTTQTTPSLGRVLRHWPVLLGVGTAALMILGLATGLELAKILAASAVVYLGAAAFGKPASTWPVFFLTFAVILAAGLIDDDFEATWAVLGLGVLLGGYGLLRGYGPGRGARPEPGGLPLQMVAMLGFGAAATVALFVNPTAGSYLVALGLLGHAAWDVYHYRANRVVTRSLAEFCLVLDTALAVTIIVLTATA